MKRGWREILCHCQRDPTCATCRGQGYVYLHEKSQRLALKPGGPFLGQQKHDTPESAGASPEGGMPED